MINEVLKGKIILVTGGFNRITKFVFDVSRAMQIGIDSSNLISYKEIKKIERNFQPYYLLLILIKHMNPSSASLSKSEVKKQLLRELELDLVFNKVMESDVDYKSIYNNSCKNGDILLHEDFINIRNQFVDNDFL